MRQLTMKSNLVQPLASKAFAFLTAALPRSSYFVFLEATNINFDTHKYTNVKKYSVHTSGSELPLEFGCGKAIKFTCVIQLGSKRFKISAMNGILS